MAGHGQDQGREGPQQVLHRVAHEGGGLPAHSLSKQVLRLPFHERDGGSLMDLADDRVGLLVPAAQLRVDDRGALAGVPPVRDAAAAGAAPADLAALPQAGVQRAALDAVLTNPLVEPREADRHGSDSLQVISHLLGSPATLEPVRDDVPDRWLELAPAGDGPVAALLSELLDMLMVIAGGAGAALELSRDGGDRESPLMRCLDLAALVVLQVAELLRHGGFSSRIS